MTTIDSELDERARRWISSALDQSASWRLEKAREYPNDHRNARSASALLNAANYARHGHGRGTYRMCELLAACEEIGYDVTEPAYGFAGERSERIAGRYCFDVETAAPNDQAHNLLLETVFMASLEDVREALEDEVPPDSRMARLFEEHLSPVVREESVTELLTEIRDLLRDRLPAVRSRSMRYTVRDTSSPGGQSSFELDLDEPPAKGEFLEQLNMVYEVQHVIPEEAVIEVRQAAGPGQAV